MLTLLWCAWASGWVPSSSRIPWTWWVSRKKNKISQIRSSIYTSIYKS
jgi:hypothetical protein